MFSYLNKPSGITNTAQRIEALQQYFIFYKKMSDAASRFYLFTLKTSDELQILEHALSKNAELIECYKKKLTIQMRIFTELTEFVKKLSAPDTLNAYLCKTDMKTQQTEMLLNLTTLTTALGKQSDTPVLSHIQTDDDNLSDSQGSGNKKTKIY